MRRHFREPQADRIDRRRKRAINDLVRPCVAAGGPLDDAGIDRDVGKLAHSSVLRCVRFAKGRTRARARIYCAPFRQGTHGGACLAQHAGMAELVDAPDSKSGF